MTTLKHTPGPWKDGYFINCEGYKQACVTSCNNGQLIAEVSFCRTVLEKKPSAEEQANARLIAAAPELLEAGHEAILAIITLKNFLLDIADIEGISGERRKEVYRQIDAADGLLDAAITKAEGKL